MNKNEIIKKMSQAIKKAEERGMSGAAIELLLAHFKKDYNLSDEEFKEYQSQACSMINESNNCKTSNTVTTNKPSSINDTKQKGPEDKQPDQKSRSVNQQDKSEIQKESYEFLDESTKAQLKKAEETLNDPNSSTKDRIIAKKVINKHKEGKKATVWKARANKELNAEPVRSTMTGENLKKFAAQDDDRFAEFHIDNGRSLKIQMLKDKGMTDEEIKKYKQTLQLTHNSGKNKKTKNTSVNQKPTFTNDLGDPDIPEEADDPRTWLHQNESYEIYANNKNEATQFLPFISGLHDIFSPTP